MKDILEKSGVPFYVLENEEDISNRHIIFLDYKRNGKEIKSTAI